MRRYCDDCVSKRARCEVLGIDLVCEKFPDSQPPGPPRLFQTLDAVKFETIRMAHNEPTQSHGLQNDRERALPGRTSINECHWLLQCRCRGHGGVDDN
jgi:hypothetical protein